MNRLADLLARPLGLMVALQLGWWAAVGGAAMEIYALGPLVIGVLLFFQSRALADRGMLVTVALLAVAGTVVDSMQSALGFISWSGPAPIVPAPLWITALWAHFGTGLQAVSKLCRERWWVLALFGGVSGPVAYLAGVRLGAATISSPQVWPSLLSFAVEWALILPLAAGMRRSTVARYQPV